MISIKKTLLFLFSMGLILSSCKKKEVPLTVPTLTTIAVTGVTASDAISGGIISSDGGATITTSGICWSKTNQTPTITDSKVEGNAMTGTFTVNLTNLTSNSTYYVRAYATNDIGTAYGNVVTFVTGNAAPTASNLSISGDTKVNAVLTAIYNYVDAEGDSETGSTFKWYVANDATGAGEAAVDGATAKTFVVQEAQQGKYIRFGVTPKTNTGTVTSLEVKSGFVGAIGEATTVTFSYNGNVVTYGIINSPVTGRKWLDRNLGAASVATSVNNYQNYGDLFQWGRGADGHQSITRSGASDANVSGVAITAVSSATDIPGDNLFISISSYPRDWRKPQNNSLWQGMNGINNPCPSGWRVPTKVEWEAEMIDNLNKGFANLKLTNTGFRLGSGGFYSIDGGGFYWTSTIGTDDPALAFYAAFSGGDTAYNEYSRTMANACRCIKN